MITSLTRFTDGVMVIVGEHLTLEETIKRFGYEYEEYIDVDELDPITSVKHWWVRYEFIGEFNCPDDYDDLSPGDALWILKETEIRPKGCVRKATVINA